MMGLENPIHILLVLVVVLMVFGAKRLPEMGKSLGEGLNGFRGAIRGDHHTDSLSVAPAPVQADAVHTEPLVVARTASGAEV